MIGYGLFFYRGEVKVGAVGKEFFVWTGARDSIEFREWGQATAGSTTDG